MRGQPVAVALAVLVAVVAVACGTPQTSTAPVASVAPTPSVSASAAASPAISQSEAPAADALDGVNLACIAIVAAECRQVAERVMAELPAARGRPLSIMIEAYGCATSPCIVSLGAGGGLVTVEFFDPGEPIVRTVFGPIANLRFGEQEMGWMGLQRAESARVSGSGPFPYELGHCGLLWKVDFDGSFWLPTGNIDGDSSALVSAGGGLIRLIDPNRATFTDPAGAVVNLVRHPGQKQIWGCR